MARQRPRRVARLLPGSVTSFPVSCKPVDRISAKEHSTFVRPEHLCMGMRPPHRCVRPRFVRAPICPFRAIVRVGSDAMWPAVRVTATSLPFVGADWIFDYITQPSPFCVLVGRPKVIPCLRNSIPGLNRLDLDEGKFSLVLDT